MAARDRFVSETVAPYHEERPHQAKNNDPLVAATSAAAPKKGKRNDDKPPPDIVDVSRVECRQRLGGLLNHHVRNLRNRPPTALQLSSNAKQHPVLNSNVWGQTLPFPTDGDRPIAIVSRRHNRNPCSRSREAVPREPGSGSCVGRPQDGLHLKDTVV